ncbi:MAG: hypothetical protein M3020_08255 [Myxococcota bacterium]|nr:hypothetical protein [Myxococcota bacterium]
MSKKARKNQGNQGTGTNAPESAEQPVSDEIRRAGERIGYDPAHPVASDVAALRALLSNGTIVDDGEDTGCDYNVRLLETVAAQLTVLQVFLAVGADNPAWQHIPLDFDRIDFQRTAAIMCASTLALVENGPRLIDVVRQNEQAEESAVTS